MVTAELIETSAQQQIAEEFTTEHQPKQQDQNDIKQAMIEMHLPMVVSIAKKVRALSPVPVHYDDLYQVGLLGLSNAINDFNPACDDSFDSHCAASIKQSILDAVRYATWVSNN